MNAPAIKWSWKITRIAGIDVFIHLTFFLILLWVGLSVWRQTGNSTAVIQGIGFVLILFTCVVMHEFGHALTARRFGIKTQRITLLPIGGVASMEKMPDDPKQEILVAIAGPAVNVAIALLIWLGLRASGIDIPTLEQTPDVLFTSGPHLLYNVMVINLVLAIFNLLPAFPMDGGRVLRGVLALAMPHHRATEKAAAIGQTLAMVMFVLGLLYNPILLLISVFIWLGAAGEAGAEKMHHLLHGVSAREVMMTRFDVLSGNDTLADAVRLTIDTHQRDFPVDLGDGRLALLTQKDLMMAMRSHADDVALSAFNLPELMRVSPETEAEEILQTLQSKRQALCGVMRGDSLLGLVSSDNLMEYISLRTGARP